MTAHEDGSRRTKRGSLNEAQIERLFTEPFSELTLRYAAALHALINAYHDLLQTVPIGCMMDIFHKSLLQASLQAIEEYNFVRSIIIRHELEVLGIYKDLIEQEATWSRLKNITMTLLMGLSIGIY
ncbi:uncharacterized protein LOC125766217 [Anopheles funestus]|uniref:uncharacterized protein LOC125766217 n=1 Tax=Anopheles funestus TaxID=62324 RepID=UPI0020C5C028|nr:uncharacterized protein LOC125766217 [Anopheles funestus]